ncbi:hypothetical protein M427DRAFT_371028 [Gonapodya prolifera JEL478]|uniref:NTF2 domain-containing protein n=1 Tax=Gonapodya prolifera (strain JEL478) TaxID=1344416 RepID=A0A139AAJ5_GONPJ|nr:hypothetical protein M427DRAFT_371028 [Gonapodya prolifera JEL478]|eukprot:KXS13393.1 hypothetical protein M427DRAFT_371028 [Gonapodya prolifera JEL478]
MMANSIHNHPSSLELAHELVQDLYMALSAADFQAASALYSPEASVTVTGVGAVADEADEDSNDAANGDGEGAVGTGRARAQRAWRAALKGDAGWTRVSISNIDVLPFAQLPLPSSTTTLIASVLGTVTLRSGRSTRFAHSLVLTPASQSDASEEGSWLIANDLFRIIAPNPAKMKLVPVVSPTPISHKPALPPSPSPVPTPSTSASVAAPPSSSSSPGPRSTTSPGPRSTTSPGPRATTPSGSGSPPRPLPNGVTPASAAEPDAPAEPPVTPANRPGSTKPHKSDGHARNASRSSNQGAPRTQHHPSRPPIRTSTPEDKQRSPSRPSSAQGGAPTTPTTPVTPATPVTPNTTSASAAGQPPARAPTASSWAALAARNTPPAPTPAPAATTPRVEPPTPRPTSTPATASPTTATAPTTGGSSASPTTATPPDRANRELELFLKGVPQNITKTDIAQIFIDQLGISGVKFMQPFPDRDFGYVEFRTREDARKAREVGVVKWDGKSMRVEAKRERGEGRGDGGGSYGRGRGGRRDQEYEEDEFESSGGGRGRGRGRGRG